MTVQADLRAGSHARRRLRSGGFSLMEVVFAIGLFALVGVVYSAAFPAAARLQSTARYRAQAVRIARREMEALRQLDFDNLNNTGYLLTASPAVVDASVPGTRICNSATQSCSFTSLSSDGQDTIAKALPGGQGDFWVNEADLTDPSVNNTNATTPQTGLRRITVRVQWNEYSKTRTLTLVSLVAYTRRTN